MSTSKLPLRLHGIHGDGILSGRAIHQAVKTKLISIEPFTVDQLNPASYDLRLGNKYKTYSTQQVLDSQKANLCNPTHEFDSLELRPGIGYLMHTAERICTDHFVPVLDGKSSIGRLFVQVHVTAGYGDPGFDGQYTLEVIALYPTILHAGQRIAQIRFHTLAHDRTLHSDLYKGQYIDSNASGPIPSASHKQK